VAFKEGEAEKAKGDLVEDLAAHLLAAQHYEVTENTRNIRSNGVEVDLQCKHKTIKSQRIYVECKAYSVDNKIQSGVIDKMVGVRTRKKYDQAWLITTSELGRDAKGVVDELEADKEHAGHFAFYTPERLVDALVASSVIISDSTAKPPVLDLLKDHKKVGKNYLMVTLYGYFWAVEYLKGGEPYGLIYVDANDGNIVTDEALLENLAVLKSPLSELKHDEILDVLQLTSEQVVIEDIKSLKLNQTYLSEINDLGFKVNRPGMPSLSLDDVQTLPDLEEIDGDRDKLISCQSIIDGTKRRVIIFGGDLSGKSTLGKIVQKSLDAKGSISLMFSASEIKSFSESKFQDFLVEKFSQQYGSNDLKKTMFRDTMQRNGESISLVIDDFEDLAIKRSDRQEALFNHLRESYGEIYILSDSSIEIEAVAKARTRDILDGFETYRILQLGHVKRDELIHRWISTTETDELSDEDALNLKLEISAKVNTAVGANFIPTYPFYVLTMVQLIEDGNKVRTQGSSYADLYNYFITHALLTTGVSPEDVDFYLTYLSYVAYTLLNKEISVISSEGLEVIYGEYSRSMALDKPFKTIHRILVNAKIFKLDEGQYSFSLSYCRYYFIAKYLSDNLDDEIVRQQVEEIISELYKNENANIVIFLVHHSKNKSIIGAIVRQAEQQFKGVLPQTLDKTETKSINGLLKEEVKFAIKDIKPEESRKKELTQQDRYERSQSQKGEKEHDILDIFGQVNLAFKTIDVLGQIANNYYGSLDGPNKAAIVSESYNLGLRGLRAFLDSFETYTGALRQYLDERMDKSGIKDEVSKNNEIDKIIYGFIQLVSYAFLKRISDSVSSRNLTPTLEEVLASQAGPSSNIVDVATKLNFSGELSRNKKKVEEIYKDLENNYLPKDLLRMFVLQHMYKFGLDYKVKQSICTQLGISYIKVKKKIQ
jgi:Holliday junction resolvase-like predicted endonuclease